MTSRKRETMASSLFRFAILAAVLLVGALGSSPVRAQSDAPEARAQKSGTRAKKARPAGPTSKAAGAKSKARVRGTTKATEPASEASATQSSPGSNDTAPATPSVRSSETVDFGDTDDAQTMEPGLELIQAAPRRARHRSLVPASPRPEDSVVNRP